MATEGGPRKGNMAGWRMEGKEKDMDKEAWRLGRRVAEQAREEISGVPWEDRETPARSRAGECGSGGETGRSSTST